MLIFSPDSHKIVFTKRAAWGCSFSSGSGRLCKRGQIRFFTFLKFPYGASFYKLQRKYRLLLGEVRVIDVVEQKLDGALTL